MHQFATGVKKHYYGKGDVIVYRLNRDGRTKPGHSPVLGATVTLLLYGDAFWPTYTSGDNTGLIATDSMKNFIQRETMNYEGSDLEGLCRFLGETFIAKYAQVEQVKRFFILDHDLSQETGELTPTLKVKRNIVNDLYAERFDELYAGH